MLENMRIETKTLEQGSWRRDKIKLKSLNLKEFVT